MSGNLILTSTGSYPRIGDSAELQLLRRTIAAADRGEKTAADLSDAENEMTSCAIGDQARSGVELLTDGLIRWYDPVSHVAAKFSGVKINGLLRFFDTNFYFRQPVLTGKPSRKTGASELVSEYRFACNALGSLPAGGGRGAKLAMKPVVTGPYTLAKFSLVENDAMNSLEARAQAYAEALAGELTDLWAAGAEMIQVDEPAIVKYPEDWKIFSDGLAALTKARDAAVKSGKRAQIALHTYFRDPAPLYDRLAKLPVNALGLDFTYNPKLVDMVASAGSPVPLLLGLVDGRNTKLEQPGTVARQIEKMLPKISGGASYLGPSCGLEYLPRDRAQDKLALLSQIRAAVNG